MKVILDLAISLDGFIAKNDGDSNWVSQACEEAFLARISEAGAVAVGRKTFEQYCGDIYPVKGVLNIVLTKQKGEMKGGVVATSPEEAIDLAKQAGCSGIVIAGGAQVSGSFLQAGLITDIFFSVHPILLGEGMSPFEGVHQEKRLQYVGSRNGSGSVVELHYQTV